jgi:hypothetical protein
MRVTPYERTILSTEKKKKSEVTNAYNGFSAGAVKTAIQPVFL